MVSPVASLLQYPSLNTRVSSLKSFSLQLTELFFGFSSLYPKRSVQGLHVPSFVSRNLPLPHAHESSDILSFSLDLKAWVYTPSHEVQLRMPSLLLYFPSSHTVHSVIFFSLVISVLPAAHVHVSPVVIKVSLQTHIFAVSLYSMYCGQGSQCDAPSGECSSLWHTVHLFEPPIENLPGGQFSHSGSVVAVQSTDILPGPQYVLHGEQ
mmetsp:Transcript_6471/g.11735  ORF Transcript_6471/g.11735 Transcript_6471/m.11735 type:complete len:208 (+) Transcript_6471:2021-2644(+)